MDLQNKENASRKIIKKKTTNKGGDENKSNSTETNRDNDIIAKAKRRKAKDDDEKKRKGKNTMNEEEESSNSINEDVVAQSKRRELDEKKKKNVGGEGRQQSDDGSKQPVATIKYTRGGIEREFLILKTVKSLEKLHDFVFKHNCAFNEVKRRPKFSTIVLSCHGASRKGCPYKLLARRPNLKHGEIIDVYAHGEHNHTVQPEAKRSYLRGERNVLIPDADPPPTHLTPDGLEWTFQRTVDNFEALNKCRTENGCNGESWNAASSHYRLHCWHAYGVMRCPFFMLARKTTKQRYHVYIRGQHNCPNRTKKQRINGVSIGERGGKPSKRSRREEKEIEDNEEMEDEKEEDGNMEAEQTEEEDGGQGEESPPIVKEYSLEKIQRRLGHSLRKGQIERTHKWMGRVGLEQIDTILTGMDLENVIKMMEMTDQELNEDRESRNFWRPWIKGARQNHGSELAKVDLQNKENAMKTAKKKGINKEGVINEPKSNLTEVNRDEDVVAKPKRRKAEDDDDKKRKRKKEMNEEEESNPNNKENVDQSKQRKLDEKKKKNVGGESRQQSEGERPAVTIKYAVNSGIEREFLFLETVNSLEDLHDFVFKHGCSSSRVKNNPKFSTTTLPCNEYAPSRKGCPYKLLARRPGPEHGEIIDVYAHGEHNHTVQPESKRSHRREKKQRKRHSGVSIEERGGKPSKRSRKKEKEFEDDAEMEDDGNMEAEEDIPPIVKEYPLAKIQRRLGHSLRKGQAHRAHKWMGRVSLGQIDTILTGMDLENVIRLMEMADREIREDKKRTKFWLPWMHRTLHYYGSKLNKAPHIVGMLAYRVPQ